MFKKAVGDLTIITEKPIVNTEPEDKPSKPLGLKVIDREGRLYITNISENGLFADSDLQAGMRLITVQGQTCNSMEDAMVMFKDVNETEEFVVVAEDPGYITATVTKESEDVKLGIALTAFNDKIYISRVNPTGLLGMTELTPGLSVVRYVVFIHYFSEF